MAGFELILSLSYELFAAHCPTAWMQRDAAGNPALTGWVPPSALLSPANDAAMGWLQGIAGDFADLAAGAGQRVRFQVGEPWWWVQPGGALCLYDDAAKAKLASDGIVIDDVTAPMSPAQIALLDRAGACLAASTAAIHAAVRARHPDAERLLLVFTPGPFDPAAPELARANAPVGWAAPAFDVLQLEDYDWLTTGREAVREAALAMARARFGYAPGATHYFAGFARSAADWPAIAAGAGSAGGFAARFVWALPQVLRDGFTWFDEEGDVEAFDDVTFPLEIGREAMVTPAFSTQIVASASGAEQRNADWAQGRMQFDAGPGVRSEADLATLIGFFRARRGAAKAFRFRDPLDWRAVDEVLGTGDGTATRFPLVKRYGAGADAEVRRLTRPVAGSVAVTLDGAPATGWTLGERGVISFAAPPAPGVVVRATCDFDVPVRFAEDRLEVSAGRWAAGEVPSVPMIEVREA